MRSSPPGHLGLDFYVLCGPASLNTGENSTRHGIMQKQHDCWETKHPIHLALIKYCSPLAQESNHRGTGLTFILGLWAHYGGYHLLDITTYQTLSEVSSASSPLTHTIAYEVGTTFVMYFPSWGFGWPRSPNCLVKELGGESRLSNDRVHSCSSSLYFTGKLVWRLKEELRLFCCESTTHSLWEERISMWVMAAGKWVGLILPVHFLHTGRHFVSERFTQTDIN